MTDDTKQEPHQPTVTALNDITIDFEVVDHHDNTRKAYAVPLTAPALTALSNLVAECLPEKQGPIIGDLNQNQRIIGHNLAIDQMRTALRSKGFEV